MLKRILIVLSLLTQSVFLQTIDSPASLGSDELNSHRLSASQAAVSALRVDDDNTTGVEDGTAQHPYNTIQEAINAAANSGDTIQVAAGTYGENIRVEDKTIQILGGYPGGTAADYANGDGGNFTDRDSTGNATEIKGNGTDAVVTFMNPGKGTLDGFRISEGTGNGDNLPWFYAGGGIFCSGGSPTISNNIIEYNDTRHSDQPDVESYGGGIWAEDSDISIIDNVIRSNTATSGGAIAIMGGSVVIRGNTVQRNIGIGDHGGGMWIASPNANISRNLVLENEVGRDLGYGQGGGIIVFGVGTSATLSFNVVRDNYAPSFGAGEFVDEGAEAVLDHELICSNVCQTDAALGGFGVYVDGGQDESGQLVGSTATLIHCTVANNGGRSEIGGNGLMLEQQSEVTVKNCIFWGNGGDDFFVDDTSTLTVTYTNSEEPIEGVGNLSVDPLFADPANNDYHLKSTAGRWDPLANAGNGGWVVDGSISPCIDAGDPASHYSDEAAPNGGRVNIGVYGNTAEASLSEPTGPPAPTPIPTRTPTAVPTATPGDTPIVPPGPGTEPSLDLIRVFTFDTADEFDEYPGGFMNFPAGTVAVGGIPPGPDDFSDGQGATITTAPGQVNLLMFPALSVGENMVVVRASVQSTSPGAAVALAVLDGSMDGSIATNVPANSGIFQGAYHRMVLVYDPPGTTILPAFQVANLSGEQEVSVYLDNLEIYLLPRGISIPSDLLYGETVGRTPLPTDTSIPTPTSRPTATPTAEQTALPAAVTGIGGGGALFSPSMSLHDPHVIYISTDMSAVFRTENFGRSWQTVDFKELQGGHNSHVRFTSNPSILYAVHTADDRWTPVKSVDGGTTWAHMPNDPTWNENAIPLHADPNSTERLFVSDWNTLYFSNDGGASFRQVYTAINEGGLLIGGVFWDGDRIFVSTLDGLLVSTNGGDSFEVASIGGIPNDEVIISFAGAKENEVLRFFAVTHDNAWVDMMPDQLWGSGGVYRLDWGQGNWAKMTTGIADCARFIFVRMALNDVDVAYVAGGNIYPCDTVPIVYKTINGGEIWTEVFLTDGNQNIATGWCGDGGDLPWTWAELAMGFAVSPIDSDRAIISDFGFAHVTEDGGASWRQAYVDPAYENPAGSNTPKGRFYRGNGLEDTSSWWLHWTGQSTLIAAFTDVRGLRSEDNGQTWFAGPSLGLPHNSTYYLTEHPITRMLYAATSSVHDMYESAWLTDSRIDGGEGHVVMSNDEGKTWQLLHDFGHPVTWLAIDPNAPDTMYASVVHSSEGGIYVTHNLSGGLSASWTKLNAPPRTEGHPFNIHVLNDGTLLATYSGRRDADGAFTESSGVFLSADGGATWEDRSDPGMRRWTKDVVIGPHDPTQNTWYVAVFSHWGSPPNEVGGIYRTTDQGRNWTRISDLYRVESVAIHPDNPDILYASTEFEGLWRSDNLTATNPTFTQLADYPFRHPVRMFFNPSNHNEVWITSFGWGLRVHEVASL